MPGRVEQAGARRRSGERAGVAVAVFHATADVEKHIAALRRARRFRLATFPQRVAVKRPQGFDGILWELRPGARPDRRRLNLLARSAPLLSYSVDDGRELSDLSRSLGFASHLKAPLRSVEVEQQLGVGARGELVTRLQSVEPKLRLRLRRQDLAERLVRDMNASLEPARVAEALLEHFASWIPAASWAVVGGDLAAQGRLLAGRSLTTTLEAAADGIGGWVIRHGEPYTNGNVAVDRRIQRPAAVAAIAFPLTCRGRTVGAVVALDRGTSTRDPALGPRTQAALDRLLELAAMTLDSALQLQRAEALSVTDDLTQLYNSRYLKLVLRRETKRASRSGRPLSLLFVDLDGFKAINDVHGHLYGSRALVEAAAIIRTSARETDVVARFGGDEFALILPDTGSDGAVSVAERVRDRVRAHGFLHGDGLHIRLTVSVGVATLPDVAASAEHLIGAADKAMYWVKEHGKDGIYVAT